MRTVGKKFKIPGPVLDASGQPLPDDEPIMLFRAKDKLLPDLMEYYISLRRQHGQSDANLADLRAYADELAAWQASHPDRLKYPD